MNGKRYIIFLGFLTTVLIVAALISESIYFSDFEYRFRTQKFNRILVEKEKIMEECLNAMKPILAMEDHHGSNTENNLFKVAEENEITILEYLDNKLAYWSDNDFDIPLFLDDSLFSSNIVFLQNGWFLSKTIKAGNEIIVGLLRVRKDYSFENDIIKSGFEKDFRIPESVGFSTDKNESGYHILNGKGDFLFSLIFPEIKMKTSFIFIPLLFWILAFVFILLLVLELAKMIFSSGQSQSAVLFVLFVFLLLYSLLLITGKPHVLFQTELFSPYRFSFNALIPSLGHLLLLSILIAALSTVFYKYSKIPEIEAGKKVRHYFVLTLLLIPGVIFLAIYHLIFSQMISSSNINFETYKILDISIFSVAGFISAILLVILPLFYLLKILASARHLSIGITIASILTSLVFLAAIYCTNPGTWIPLTIFYLIMALTLCKAVRIKIGAFSMTVIFSLLFGLYSLYFIIILSDVRTTENLKIQAVSLSAENDPEAELLFIDMWPVISKDTILAGLMQIDYFGKDDEEKIKHYLQVNYFNGYWSNFYFNIVLCRDDQSLSVGPANEVVENCFGFFNDRIRLDGHKITGTGFYFVDNQGGRSFYLGRLYYRTSAAVLNGLFIELYSDINFFYPGYSELLLDKKYHGYTGIKDYSFAKYINGELVLRTEDFPYDKTDAAYLDKTTDFRLFRTEGFKHILYKNGNSTIMITRPELSFGDIIISFAYIFAFVLIVSNIFLLLMRKVSLKRPNVLNFRQKLQLSFIGILLFSFILIGIVVAYLTVNQFHSKHYENIREKLNSVYVELDSRLSSEKQIISDLRNNDYSSLNELLIKLSNTFNTDINLYDLTGLLVATSRPEIFSRNLSSRRINNIAYINLRDLTKSEYIQKEMIGSLEYVSAYVPFFGSDNRVLAYLNLPYFRMQSVLAREISNLIVAIINFTLLLIVITMSLAVFISGRLTSPLTMLGEGLASVGVGRKSEHLVYRGSDEIGELVKQYNTMVDEIEESTHKLANSEREYAWREMAKQIAHEIKNPLTPMKLNVQQLFKSWNDSAPGFDKLLERFTRNQIEYIDNLSSIATAFSSFAKMPGNNPVEINLLDQIRTTLELFKNTDNVKFSVNWPHESKVMIYADREHLNSVFANLIKNGIQSIPPGKEGSINVDIGIKSDKVVVSISDNGSGIPEVLQRKLFTPNFTTKSSGMGLGLSITKKYIENANGRIWFESEADKGSVFFVELPLIYTVEKLG